MGNMVDLMMMLIMMGGAIYVYKSGMLDQLMQGSTGGAGGAGGAATTPEGQNTIAHPRTGTPIVGDSLREEMATQFKLSPREECLAATDHNSKTVKSCECVDFKGLKIANCTYKDGLKCNSANCASEATRKKLNFKCECDSLEAPTKQTAISRDDGYEWDLSYLGADPLSFAPSIA